MMKPVASLQEALDLVDAFVGPPSEFQLVISDSLNDPAGVAMAVITDRTLARGWMPKGFIQGDGYRIYEYDFLE